MAIITSMIPSMLNTEVAEAVRMVEVMHYGLFPAIFTIGLICFLCRNESLETAKKILLSYIIGTSILMCMFFMVFANEPLMNFSIGMVVPDIIVYLIQNYLIIKKTIGNRNRHINCFHMTKGVFYSTNCYHQSIILEFFMVINLQT